MLFEGNNMSTTAVRLQRLPFISACYCVLVRYTVTLACRVQLNMNRTEEVRGYPNRVLPVRRHRLDNKPWKLPKPTQSPTHVTLRVGEGGRGSNILLTDPSA